MKQEQSDREKFEREAELERKWSVDDFRSYFGNRSLESIIQMFFITWQAYHKQQKVNQLSAALEERLMIVPGDNSIGIGQLSALMSVYRKHRHLIDFLVEKHEREKEHG